MGAALRTALVVALMLAAGDGARGQGDPALGQYLSSECVTCHQLTGQYQGIPPIVGWPDAYSSTS